ncbi:PIG-L deacetylase family protein [Halobacillus campisalis]|uniref:PIG-L deacetylase family protein n=1 Tax=Halobacillus campisalis TaxID=435909 RepID=A0ABW2K6R6_9BACI|nr:PIG-L family deacetylase [Halobacillus campisalis]
MNLKRFLIEGSKPVITPITKVILKKHYTSNLSITPLGNYKKVLIVAPHMDDETIGLGGTIKRHIQEGAEVHCVFSTDGSNSESELSREELSRIRKDEIEKVNELLGMDSIHYMDLPDGNVQSTSEAQNKLISLLEQIEPDLIYCTPFVDAHPDHTGTTAILSDCLKLRRNGEKIRLYEINCPIPPREINCVIDITSTYPTKKDAIKLFTSQAIAFDGFLLLNKLKSHMVKDRSVSAAEVFIEVDADQFTKQFDKLREKNYPYHKMFKQANRVVTLLWAMFKNYPQKKRIYQERLSKN